MPDAVKLEPCPACGPDGRPETFSRFSSDEGETHPVICYRCKFEAPSAKAWNTRTPSITASSEGEATAEEIAAHDATRYYGRLQGAEDALLACYIAMRQSAKASMNGGSDWRTLETVAKRKMVAEAVALWGGQKLPATPTPSASTEGEAPEQQLLSELIVAAKSLLSELDKGSIKIIWQKGTWAGEEGNLSYLRLILERLAATPTPPSASTEGEPKP